MILPRWSELRCLERVALAGIARIDPSLEPAHALRGAAVGERLRHDAPLRLALEAVVADRRGGVQALLDVTALENLPGALRVVRPDARQAVGLKLHAHLQRIALGLAATALRLVDALGDAEQVLDVMADLVGDDVGLGEVAGSAELVAQVTVERQIDVDLVVAGTVEGADRRLGEAARRLRGAAEQHELGLLVAPAHLAEELAPRVLGVGEDDRDEVAQLLVPGRPLLLLHARRGPGAALVSSLEDHARIDAEVHGDEHEQQGSDAAADGGPTADRHATAVLDVVTASAQLPSHHWPPASLPRRPGPVAVVAFAVRVVRKVYEWRPTAARPRCVALRAGLCHHRPAAARVRDRSYCTLKEEHPPDFDAPLREARRRDRATSPYAHGISIALGPRI